MAKLTFLDFFRAQWATLPPVPDVDLSAQTVIITGANNGLGFEAAKHFARLRPKHLVLVCRSRDKGEQAIHDIKAATGFTPEMLLMDMADFASVSAFANAFTDKYDRLDILVCNAGIAVSTFELSKHGFESTVQVNHLSTALVSLLLLPRMLETARTHGTHPRLVVVTSETHFWADLDAEVRAAPSLLGVLSSRAYCVDQGKMDARYPLSKLLNVLFTRALAARVAPAAPLVAACVNPGFCYSGLRRNAPRLVLVRFAIMDLLLGRAAAEGGKTLVWGALAGHGDASARDSLKGAYMSNCKAAEPSDFVLSPEGRETERRLWDETIEILEKADSRVQGIVAEYLTR